MKWMPVRNFEDRAYIIGKVARQVRYLNSEGRIVAQPYMYDDFFSALMDLRKFVPEERRDESSTPQL